MIENSFLKRIDLLDHGRVSEKRVGKLVGGKMTPGSGALQGAKGDVVDVNYLLECKATINKSMSLEYSWLVKISTEAMNVGKYPALSISFTERGGKPIRNGDWVMVPLHIFKELVRGR